MARDGRQVLAPIRRHSFHLIAVVLIAVCFSWVALLNGQPLFTPDSINYVRSPDIAVQKILGAGYATAWSHKAAGESSFGGAAGPAPSGANGASASDHAVQGGRSIYYGALAYLGLRLGGLWATVFLQGLVVALLIDIVVRRFGWSDLKIYVATSLILASLTSCAFFASFLMPDVWAGVAIIAMCALAGLQDRLSRAEALFLGLVVGYSALTHNSIAAVVLIMTLAAGILGVLARPRRLSRNLAVWVGLAAVVTAAFGGMAFNAAVAKITGSQPGSPPFLMARLIADGPGTRFLREHCATERFDVCRFAARFPMSSQQFLWGRAPSEGVMKQVSAAERRALSSEQLRFAVAVVRNYPGEELYSAVRNTLLQISTLEDADLNYDSGMKQTLHDAMPDGDFNRARRSLAFRGLWPAALIARVQALVALGSVLTIGWFLIRTPPGLFGSAASRFGLLMVLGVLANAAVCGILSEVVGRYQSRVVWVLPLGAIMLALTWWKARAVSSA